MDYSLTIKLFEQAKQDAAVCCQYRSKYQGYNGHQFDQDVHCRPGSIFERVTYSIAYYGCIMHRSMFTAGSFYELLSVIPCTASVSHQDCNQYAGSQRAANQAAQSFSTKQEANQQRSNDSDNTRHNHLVQSSCSGDVYAFLVVSFSFAFQQAGDFVGYIDRCSYLLQQGLFVAAVLIYNGDDVPHMVFLKEEEAGFPFGYDWDKCSKSVVLERLSLDADSLIELPHRMSNRELVLPPLETIDLDVMRRIERMVLDGMTRVGEPPKRATGLAHYPDGDRELKEITDRMWRCVLGGWLVGGIRSV